MANRVNPPLDGALEALFASIPPNSPYPHRPFVTLSYAQSLDGSITTRAGESLLLSDRQAMIMTHRLRAVHDGILVGIGTVLADNPRLTTRLVPGAHPRPVILDTHLRLPLQALILNHPLSPWVACAEGVRLGRKTALLDAGADLIPLQEGRQGQLDLGLVLEHIKSRGIGSLMVEGGARVITSFLSQELVDLLVLTISPRLVGGLHTPSELLPIPPVLTAPAWTSLGDDQVVWGSLEWSPR